MTQEQWQFLSQVHARTIHDGDLGMQIRMAAEQGASPKDLQIMVEDYVFLQHKDEPWFDTSSWRSMVVSVMKDLLTFAAFVKALAGWVAAGAAFLL